MKPFVTTTAVNMEIITPAKRVVAKLLTCGGLKGSSITTAAMMVVMLESIIALSALEKPESTALTNGLPLLNSSLILSKITILASTAMPMLRTTPAMEGKVSWSQGKVPTKK